MKNKTENMFRKYSGAGNDFVVLDGRGEETAALCGRFRNPDAIAAVCDRRNGYRAPDGRIGADGLMILSDAQGCDFGMEYYNSDGSGGMMCGNGGRCITAFAHHLGIRPGREGRYVFKAPDGLHEAEVLSEDGNVCTVRLGMTDPFDLRREPEGYFMNTGTRHLVVFTDDVESVDVDAEGRRLRHDPRFAPPGTNVNFVSLCGGPLLSSGRQGLKVRTFEKGVEAETLACGTGITACAIAAFLKGTAPHEKSADGRVLYRMQARKDWLSVDFVPASPAVRVYLTGPAELVV